ncbi:MAG: serine/threonine-protein kinase [Ardenticatenaceae bacterium]|nr:serine/threonine-protein kinase [Ardenticatenaceae bacterium]MCB9003464.1 serine/threonine-protein kinase [Ardenticatenaceae bacterium]
MADSSSLIGQQIGQYRIVRHIGRGGMADVYLAHDETLQRDVVIKTMLPAIAQNEELLARFQREAQTTARLFHANLVQVYTAGVTPTEQPYLVMQYIEGGALSDHLRQLAREDQWVTTIYALSIVRQVADALRVAHQAGVIHRDIKPSNVLLHGDGSPVLTDLGIAAVQMETTRLTQTGGVMGTPHYMAPEQGSGKPVDGRSDIYSLGIILYELLSGQLPFEADSPWGIIHQHLYEAPPPLRQLRPGLAAQTYKVVETCLQKSPENRYQNASDLVAAIDQALAAEGAQAGGLPGTWRPPAERAFHFPRTTRPTVVETTLPASGTRRFKWQYALAAFLVVIVLGGVIFALLPDSDGTDEVADAPTRLLPSPTIFPTVTALPTSTASLVQVDHEATAVPPATPLPATEIVPTATAVPPTAVPTTPAYQYPDGLIAFSCSSALFLYDPANGTQFALPGQPNSSIVPAFAPGGTELSFRSDAGGSWQIYTAQFDGSQLRQITTGTAHYEAVWSPDWQQFAFVSDRTGTRQIYVMNRDGSGERALTANSSVNDDPTWSVDGMIAFESNKDGRYNIYQVPASGGVVELLIGLGDSSSTPAWSPDGNSIAFEVRIGDERQIWVADANGRNPRQITDRGQNNERPAWSADGTQLAFHSNTQQSSNNDYDIWVVTLATGEWQRITYQGSCYNPAWSAPIP